MVILLLYNNNNNNICLKSNIQTSSVDYAPIGPTHHALNSRRFTILIHNKKEWLTLWLYTCKFFFLSNVDCITGWVYVLFWTCRTYKTIRYYYRMDMVLCVMWKWHAPVSKQILIKTIINIRTIIIGEYPLEGLDRSTPDSWGHWFRP